MRSKTMAKTIGMSVFQFIDVILYRSQKMSALNATIFGGDED